MITIDEAKKQVKQILISLNQQDCFNEDGDEVVISKIIEYDFGWIFFYASKHFLNTGDSNYLIGGTGPFIINRYNGKLFWLDSINPYQYYVEYFQKAYRENPDMEAFDLSLIPGYKQEYESPFKVKMKELRFKVVLLLNKIIYGNEFGIKKGKYKDLLE